MRYPLGRIILGTILIHIGYDFGINPILFALWIGIAYGLHDTMRERRNQ